MFKDILIIFCGAFFGVVIASDVFIRRVKQYTQIEEVCC